MVAKDGGRKGMRRLEQLLFTQGVEEDNKVGKSESEVLFRI